MKYAGHGLGAVNEREAFNMGYPIGTRVRVRRDLEVGKAYGDERSEVTIEVEEEMARMRGKVTTITDNEGADYGVYKLGDDGYFYNRQMFDVLPPERMEAKATWIR